MDFAMNDWTKERDLLIEDTLAFVQRVAADAPKTTGAPKPVVASVLPPVVAEVLTPKNRLDMERAVIQRRVANFAANQKKFQQDREEYYARTMADARATQWTAPRHLATTTATAEPTVGPRTTLPPNSQ
jgi:hypothetical protein